LPRRKNVNAGNIQITEPDLARLADLLEGERRWPGMDRELLRALSHKLGDAERVRGDEIPRDVITLQSRVRVKDLETGTDATYLLVTPAHASPSAGTISVLSPVGAALLGRRQGDTIECPVPGGPRRLIVEQVLYQPEAAARRSTGPNGIAAQAGTRQRPDEGLPSLLSRVA
jgi:regulator of nucleoside diphosphate kinase